MRTFLRPLITKDITYRTLHLSFNGIQLRGINVTSQAQIIRPPSFLFRTCENSSVLKSSPLRQNELTFRCFSSGKVAVQQPKTKRQENNSEKNTMVNMDVVAKEFNQGSPDYEKCISELYKMIKEHKRNATKLSIICNALKQVDYKLNIKDLSYLLYLLAVLNVQDENLLMNLSKNVRLHLDCAYKTRPLIPSISKSLSSLLIRDIPTLDALINWYHDRMPEVDLLAATETICALAHLNYFPAEAEFVLKELMFTELCEYTSSVKYLNFVWALVLLDRANTKMIESVLDKDFRRKLESVLGPTIWPSAYMKLTNIYSYAKLRKLQTKADIGWQTMESPWMSKLRQKRRNDVAIKNLLDSLANLLPHRTYTVFSESPSGCIIDAVCFFDAESKPITELEFVKNKTGTKLALILLGYNDLCLPAKTVPTGICEFHKRYLEASNYKVLYVPYCQIPLNANLRTKSLNLKSMILSVLANSDANWYEWNLDGEWKPP